MKRTQKTLTELKNELGEYFQHEHVVTLVNTIDDELVFEDIYRKRVAGTEGEECAQGIVDILKTCAEKGLDIQAHVESLIKFQKITRILK